MIDAHLHLDLPDVEYYTTRTSTLEQILENMARYDVESSYVFLNPAFKHLVCPDFLDHEHRTMLDASSTNCHLICSKCGRELYNGGDCYHDYNIQLLNLVKPHKNLKPLVFLASSPFTIQAEVEFFENNYGDQVCGYKIYPVLFCNNMNNLNFNSNKPVLIHDIKGDKEYNQSIIDFAKRYKGNVIVAHLGRFDEGMIDAINSTPNLYTDMSPFCELVERTFGNQDKQQILDFVLSKIDNDKIVFGTDAPSGKYDKEMQFILNAKLDKAVFDKITDLNVKKIFQ